MSVWGRVSGGCRFLKAEVCASPGLGTVPCLRTWVWEETDDWLTQTPFQAWWMVVQFSGAGAGVGVGEAGMCSELTQSVGMGRRREIRMI